MKIVGWMVWGFLALVSNQADAADFKVVAPTSWKKTEVEFSGDAYRNVKSKNHQTVLTHTYSLSGSGDLKEMLKDMKSFSAVRSAYLKRLGILGYNVLDIQVKTTKQAPFQNIFTIQSTYRSVKGQEVQMVERQYVAPSKMYVVTYTEESTSLNGLSRANAILDNFKPVYAASREPASSDVVTSDNGGTVKREEDGGDFQSFLLYKDPTTNPHCKPLVGTDRIYSEEDKSLFEEKGATAAGGACLLTMGKAIGKLALFVADKLSPLPSQETEQYYARYYNDPAFRAEQDAASATLRSEMSNHPWDLAQRTVSNILRSAASNLKEIPCLKRIHQVQIGCKVLGYLLPPTTLFFKLARGAKLLPEEAAKVAELTRRAMEEAKLAGGAARVETAAAGAGKSLVDKMKDAVGGAQWRVEREAPTDSVHWVPGMAEGRNANFPKQFYAGSIEKALPGNLSQPVREVFTTSPKAFDVTHYPFAKDTMYTRFRYYYKPMPKGADPHSYGAFEVSQNASLQITPRTVSVNILDKPYEGAHNNLYFFLEENASRFPYAKKSASGGSIEFPTEQLPQFIQDLRAMGYEVLRYGGS